MERLNENIQVISHEEMQLTSGGQMSSNTSLAYDIAYCIGYGLTFLIWINQLNGIL